MTRTGVGLVFALGLTSIAAAQPTKAPRTPQGSIRLDVVVTDSTGKPATGLQPQDFSLLDEGKGLKIATFSPESSDGAAPTQIILVMDFVNSGFVEMGYIREGLESYLRQGNGKLAEPTTIVRLVPSGLQFVSTASRDGNALASAVHSLGGATHPRGLDPFELSMNALLTLFRNEVNQPGRKLVLWLGPGWPTPQLNRTAFSKADERLLSKGFQLAGHLAKAMQQGHIVLYGGFAGTDFYMRDYLKPVEKVSDFDLRALSLEVLATKSGGRAELPFINRDSDASDAIRQFVADAHGYYTITFNPPPARGQDDFHSLRVTVNRPGLTSRTASGYFDEPQYATLPETPAPSISLPKAPPAEESVPMRRVSVAELRDVVQNSKGRRDGEIAQQLEHLHLTERLSSTDLARLRTQLKGTKAAQALLALADVSAFLPPPLAEIPDSSAPNLAEQKQIVSRAVDYLAQTLPKLPDFFAQRTTESFETLQAQLPLPRQGPPEPSAPMRWESRTVATVTYRDGKEVVDASSVHSKGSAKTPNGIATEGTFGPILTTVVLDAAHSATHWSRWETGPYGTMAVFAFAVPEQNSHYRVWSAAPSGGSPDTATPAQAYHGEVGIDGSTGRILRLELVADLPVGQPISEGDIMVEYGTVNIGGKDYTCPVRSVSYSTGRSPESQSLGALAAPREVTWLNDVTFDQYHVFRTDMKLIP